MSYKTLSLKKSQKTIVCFIVRCFLTKNIPVKKKKEIILNDYRRIKNLFFH